MTLKENYLAALAHKTPEIVPIYGKPVRYNVGLYDWFEKGPKGGGKDGFGIMWEYTPSDGGAVPSTAGFVITDVTKWKEQVTFPDLDSIDWAAKAEKELASLDRNNQVMEYCLGNGPFERFLDLMGYEALTYAFYDEPQACHDFLDAFMDYRIKYTKIIGEYYQPDFVVVFDDVAYEKGPFLSKDIYREFIKPCHIRQNEAIKEIGAQPINHCCGKAEALIEDFLEEGAIAWSSIQPSNDIVGLLKKYGDRYSFIGGFDTQGPAASLTATEAERRAEVRRAIDTYAPYGSFILGNHIVAGLTPEETMEYTRQTTDEAVKYGAEFYKKMKK